MASARLNYTLVFCNWGLFLSHFFKIKSNSSSEGGSLETAHCCNWFLADGAAEWNASLHKCTKDSWDTLRKKKTHKFHCFKIGILGLLIKRVINPCRWNIFQWLVLQMMKATVGPWCRTGSSVWTQTKSVILLMMHIYEGSTFLYIYIYGPVGRVKESFTVAAEVWTNCRGRRVWGGTWIIVWRTVLGLDLVGFTHEPLWWLHYVSPRLDILTCRTSFYVSSQCTFVKMVSP